MWRFLFLLRRGGRYVAPFTYRPLCAGETLRRYGAVGASGEGQQATTLLLTGPWSSAWLCCTLGMARERESGGRVHAEANVRRMPCILFRWHGPCIPFKCLLPSDSSVAHHGRSSRRCPLRSQERERLRSQERERAATWRRALEQFDRAEQCALELLAQSDRYGDSPWLVTEWEELLDQIASLHSQVQIIRARMDGLRPEQG
jgi:hypothetical protein